MLSFSHPWLLLLLPAVPLLAWWRLRHRRSALRFSDARLIESLPQNRARYIRRFDAILHAAALFAMIAALAGPRRPLPTPIQTEGIAIVLAVDVSGSMREIDFEWNGVQISRLEAVKRAFGLFVIGGIGPDGQIFAGRPSDLIGLVTFATYPEPTAPLTLSHLVLIHLLEAEQGRPLDESQTNIGDAIAEAVALLDKAGDRRKVLILLSDGEHNFPGPAHAPTESPRWGAQRAQDLGIPIYAIDAGTDAGASDPAARAAGIAGMREIAEMTGGKAFSARDGEALLGACREIDKLERRPIQSFRYQRYRNIHTPFGLAAVVLLLLARLLDATAGRRIP
jgi:Ca-activated chloride channel family protein